MAEITEIYEQEYGTIVTKKGLAAIAHALANDVKLGVTHVAFGDGGGEEYFPDKSQEDIKNEVYLAEAADVYADPANPNCLIVTTRIPAKEGGWNVCEAALRLGNGDTVAVATMTTITKPAIASGNGLDLKYEFVFIVSNVEAFEFKVDPNTEAVREYIRVSMQEHNDDPNAHGGLTEKVVEKAEEAIKDVLEGAKEDIGNAIEEVQDAAKEVEKVKEEILEIVTKEVSKARTVFDFEMTKNESGITLTVNELPEPLPSLLTLRGLATSDYLYSDAIFINDVPVRLLTPAMYPIVKAAWAEGGGIQLLWDTTAKHLFYQNAGNENDTGGGGGNDGDGDDDGDGDGGTEPPISAEDWDENRDYEVTDLSYGKVTKKLFESIEPSGPSYPIGPRNPEKEPVPDLNTPDLKQQEIVIFPKTNHWWDVACGNNLFVVSPHNDNGEKSSLCSSNGVDWSAANMPRSGAWHSITFGKGKFVSVCQESNIAAYCTNGLDWKASELPFDAYWNAVIFGNDRFVAFAGIGKGAYSLDGVNWIASTNPIDSSIKGAYGNGLFVIVNGEKYAFSSDGINWTVKDVPSGKFWQNIVFGNGKFVVTEAGNREIGSSEDAINWDFISLSLTSNTGMNGIAYANRLFVTISNNNPSGALYSTDAKNWLVMKIEGDVTTSSAVYWSSIAGGDGKFIAPLSGTNKGIVLKVETKNLPNCWKQVG